MSCLGNCLSLFKDLAAFLADSIACIAFPFTCRLYYIYEYRTMFVRLNKTSLFKYLTEQKGFQGWDKGHKLTGILDEMLKKEDPDYQQKPDIKWNFTKFLTNKRGMVVDRFEPTASIESIEERIQQLLQEEI